ncbi:hypothetical protein HNQ02_000889 [Flavobacterium sp. 7E]|uniref:hypothetical protein n=1 Tax=Flavobacterium sp. 7E TaxID=2735898 RepID=UPI00156D5452|nr:hypothetical protein [Flavobacterium sp. 7E]NRS87979.1 hypothetical protein [Flavobacterium sp. 7E]
MKKIYAFLFLLPLLTFSQVNDEKYDYFVQLNTAEFSKKVNIDSLFNHKLFKSFNKEDSKIKLINFVASLDKSRNATIHGNYKDSLSYTQITLPILDENSITQMVQQIIKKSDSTNSEHIIKNSNYSLFSPAKEDFTIAWDQNVLILYVTYNTAANRNLAYADYDEEGVVEEEYAEDVADNDTVVVSEAEDVVYDNNEIESTAVVAVDTTETEEVYYEDDEEYDDAYYEKIRAENEIILAEERKLTHEKHAIAIAKIFENGFETPYSSKVNTKADVSAWINYETFSEKISSFYYAIAKLATNNVPTPAMHSIKGMYLDMFFENDKARVEETIEYSKPLADIMKKVISRKPNKNIFQFFPKTEPLAYLSYHMSTEEILKNYPSLIEQSFSNLPIKKYGIDIALDLMTTIVDEEATATLLDGDFTVFFHGIEKYDYTYKSVDYDDDYEEVEVEKTISKTRPIFSFIVTSTHPKMSAKLLDLGVKQKVLTLDNGVYKLKKTEQTGEISIIRDGDVLVFSNGMDYLTNGARSDFSNKVSKDLSKNNFIGNINIGKFIKAYMQTEELGQNTAKALRVSNQFKNIELKLSNKISGNKMKMNINLQSNFSNQNIILQSLDLIDYVK